MFRNICPDSVRSGRTCPANLGVRSCPVRNSYAQSGRALSRLLLYKHLYNVTDISHLILSNEVTMLKKWEGVSPRIYFNCIIEWSLATGNSSGLSFSFFLYSVAHLRCLFLLC